MQVRIRYSVYSGLCLSGWCYSGNYPQTISFVLPYYYSHYLPFLLLVSNPHFICIMLISTFSQSDLHIGCNLRAFVICINKLPSFLLNVFNFCLILFISVLTDLMNLSNSINWIRDLFYLDYSVRT